MLALTRCVYSSAEGHGLTSLVSSPPIFGIFGGCAITVCPVACEISSIIEARKNTSRLRDSFLVARQIHESWEKFFVGLCTKLNISQCLNRVSELVSRTLSQNKAGR